MTTDHRTLATGQGEKILIRALEPDGAAAWDEFVGRQPNSSTYHLAGWHRVITDLYGHETYYWQATAPDGRIVGVLPLVRLRSRLFGDFLISMPYFTYGGVIAASEDVEQQLLLHACEHAKELGVRHVEFRDDRPRAGWKHVRTDKVTMHLALPNTVDELWSSLKSERRNRIKKPQKEGATTRFGGRDCLDDFYHVFSRNMRDLGTPVYGREFFDRILVEFPDYVTLVVTQFQDKPVAAAFLMHHQNAIEVPWVSSVRDFNHLSFNILLYWECLKFTIEAGKRVFDFGRSSVGSGTHTFKQRWGAVEKQLYWHYWLNDGVSMPNLTPNNPKFQMAVKVWQKLPLFMTNAIGPGIIRYLP